MSDALFNAIDSDDADAIRAALSQEPELALAIEQHRASK